MDLASGHTAIDSTPMKESYTRFVTGPFPNPHPPEKLINRIPQPHSDDSDLQRDAHRDWLFI